MSESLKLGEKIELTVTYEMEVVRDTTGILEFPTYEVYDRNTSRYKVVNYDEQLQRWTALKKTDAIRYYDVARVLKAKERLDAKSQKRQAKTLQLPFPAEVRNHSNSDINHLVRHGKYEIEKILPLLRGDQRSNRNQYIELDGALVKITSKRYSVFKKSLVCAGCGMKAAFFAVEKSIYQRENAKWHFNLYGLTEQGGEVIFTKDHIIPVAKNGSNALENLQTMCIICNMDKADKIHEKVCN